MKMVTFSVIGLGGRANVYLTALEKKFNRQFKIVAIAEPNKEKQIKFKNRFNIEDKYIFSTDSDLLKEERLSDVAIVATQDKLHLSEVMGLLEKGYDIILEKPIASKYEEIIELAKIIKQYPKQNIIVCHVLRYTNLFRTLKQLIESQKLGKVIDIQHNENIGYYHFVHSYVRGPWRNAEESSPLIVAKSCHDLDIMLYLLGDKHCKRIASFGSLSLFNSKNYNPQKMAPYCVDCKVENDCPYSAIKIYSSSKIKSVAFDLTSKDTFEEELQNSPYGRCVFNCDNNVVDHQVTIIEFEEGITATFNLSAFTSSVKRTLKIMFEYGEIRACEKPYEIEIHNFKTGAVEKINIEVNQGGHGGGDENFMIDFMNHYLNDKKFSSTLEMSIESHIMAFLAEDSRVNNGEVKNVFATMSKII